MPERVIYVIDYPYFMKTEMIMLEHPEQKTLKKDGKIEEDFVSRMVKSLESAKNGKIRRVA